ncbi:MAG: hypothetical protein Q4B70_05780 [Lachnospiraceae bacterium]|nr:hypothetical protein [Lachnospiraceae bacterium]
MNENLIEEENTVYEIDPDCQIVSLSAKNPIPKYQCLKEIERKKEDKKLEKCKNSAVSVFLLCILFWAKGR